MTQKRLLFVRGPAGQIKEIEKLVKAFDVASDKLKKQSFGTVHLLPLRGESAGQVQSILSQLGMQTQAVQLGQAQVVVVADSDEEELQQIEEVIESLDAAESDASTTATTTTEAVKTTETKSRVETRQIVEMETTGIEPATPALQRLCSPN